MSTKYKRLDTQSMRDVLDHSQVCNNPSFLHSGLKRALDEIDRLVEVLEFIKTHECARPKVAAALALLGKEYNGKSEDKECVGKEIEAEG